MTTPPQKELDALAKAGRKGAAAEKAFAAKCRSITAAFNEWMRLYTEDPEQFEREWQSVNEYLTEVGEGKEPTYGATCAMFFMKLLAEADKKRGIDVKQAAKSLSKLTDTLATEDK